MFEWLKRLFRGKREIEESRGRAVIPTSEHRQRLKELDREIQEHRERIRGLDREIQEFKRRQREQLARRVRPKTPLEALKEANRRRQPASQRYTREKIRGLPPRSARKKRMWRLQVSKEELDEL